MAAFEFDPKQYPQKPGCYVMRSADGRVLYVGKSKQIRSRLRAYFNGTDKRRRIPELIAQIAEIGIIVVENEHESLILENNLIKIHKPPYNRALKKDNSGYAYLQLTDEPLPRLTAHYRDRRGAREEQPIGAALNQADPILQAAAETASASEASEVTDHKKKRSRLPTVKPSPVTDSLIGIPVQRFGPFYSSRFREAVIDFVTEHFKLRTCNTLPKRACLEYHIGKCSGVCEGYISGEDYRQTVKDAASLLANQGDRLIPAMYAQMEAYSDKLAFEKAESMLRHIRILEREPERQIVDRETDITQEAVYFGKDRIAIAVLHNGMLHRLETMDWSRGDDAAACDRFLISRYRGGSPQEIIVSEVSDLALVRAALRRRGEPPVRLTLPKRGLKRELLLLCKRNLDEFA